MKTDGPEGTCGECNKSFTPLCEEKFDCPLHIGKCFCCKPCKSESSKSIFQLQQCAICPRKDNMDEFFFDHKCGCFLCKDHILSLNECFSLNEVEIPCSLKCTIDSEHIIKFQMNFCRFCGRKMNPNEQVNLCGICSYYDSLVLDEQQQNKQHNQNNIPSEPVQTQNSQQKQKIAELEKQLEKQRNKNARILAETKIVTEQQIRCDLCYENFDEQEHKPMMICIRQHLLCWKCLQMYDKCHLCDDLIQKSSVLISRTTIILLKMSKNIYQHQQLNVGIEKKKKIGKTKKTTQRKSLLKRSK